MEERLSIRLRKCNSRKSGTCKSPEEIDDFIDQAHVTQYFNSHFYDSNGYNTDADIVRNKLKHVTTKLSSDRPTLNSLDVQRNKIESEETFLNLGFSLKELDFFSITHAPAALNKESLNLVFRVNYSMNPDQVIYERSIYTFWDLAGDVGGLFDFLKLVGFQLTTFVSFLTGSGLDRFLVSKLFLREQRKSSASDDIKKVVGNRKSANFQTWICRRRSKNEIL